MMLCVFIQQKYFNLIKNLEVVSKPTGIANIIGNKGGIMVTFEILDSSFCFITCHLAAKPNNIELRKANYYDLIRSLRTGIHEVEAIFQFDYVFWCGDMNFRVDSKYKL